MNETRSMTGKTVLVEGVTGQYFSGRKPKKTNPLSYDAVAVERLWQVSADLVRLTSNAPD